MEKNDQIPMEFYYQEIFNALIGSVASAQKDRTGIPLRVHELESMKRRFVSKINRENLSPEDCLKTLYSVALVHNSKTPIPQQKSEIKRKLIDKLSRDYLRSEFAKFTDSEFQVRNQLNIDFPNYSSFDLDALEGKPLKSDTSVQKIEKLFFDTYDSIISKSPFFKKHPLLKRATIKQSQKSVRYKAPLGTKQKVLLAGLTLATATQLFTLVPISNSPTIETPTPVETISASTTNNNENSPEEVALNYIYSNPNSLVKLGVSPEISDQFSQYLKYRDRVDNGIELTGGQKEEYDSMRRFIVDSITTTTLDRAISNSFSTYPESVDINALNGLEADVNFTIGANSYSFKIQNSNDIDGYQGGVSGSDLAQAISSRDIFLSKKMNNMENLNNRSRDDLDSAIESAIRFTMRRVNVDKENNIITEEENPDILNQLGIDTIEHDDDER